MEKGFYVGWGMEDITPQKPTAVFGQFHDRISKGTLDPLMVTALVMESIDEEGRSSGCSAMVSCDLNDMPASLQEAVRKRLDGAIPGFDINRLILAATHIHTGPFLLRYGPGNNPNDYSFSFPDHMEGIITPEEYCEFFIEKVFQAIKSAWEHRLKSGVSWQLGHATVGHNRRLVYDDGSAVMYGNSNSVHFREVEGPQDTGVEMLYFWDDQEELTGILMNVACPAQVVENLDHITADYWGAFRKKFWSKYGRKIPVYAMCGAAGDQSPRDLVRRDRGEKDMFSMEGVEEIGERLLQAFEYKLEDAKKTIVTYPEFVHSYKKIPLPYRRVNKSEYEQAKKKYEMLVDRYGERKKPYISKENYELFDDYYALYESIGVLENAKYVEESPVYEAETHIIRLGEIAIASNPFELFTNFGLMIKARSKGVQTFISQLSCDDAGYLATEAAIKGGSYSVCAAAGLVGPEGGQILVDQTVKYINDLWKECR